MGKCFACGQKISSFERLEDDSPLVAKIEAIRSASLMMSWQQVDYAITAALKDALYVDGVLSDYRDMKFLELKRDQEIEAARDAWRQLCLGGHVAPWGGESADLQKRLDQYFGAMDGGNGK